jgi:hypothetical protein
MRSIKGVTPREDWTYLHSLAQDELSRMMRRENDLIEDRSQILVEQWMPELKELGPHLSSAHLATLVPVVSGCHNPRKTGELQLRRRLPSASRQTGPQAPWT